MTVTDTPVGDRRSAGSGVGTTAPGQIGIDDRSTGGRVGGSTRITSRALDRLISAVAADAFGSDPKKISVDVTDEGGSLSLAIRCPVKVPSLDRVLADQSVVGRTGGSIIDRAQTARDSIQQRVSQLTGHSVRRVTVRLTSADLTRERRVR